MREDLWRQCSGRAATRSCKQPPASSNRLVLCPSPPPPPEDPTPTADKQQETVLLPVSVDGSGLANLVILDCDEPVW